MAIRSRQSSVPVRRVETEDEAWELLASFSDQASGGVPFIPQFGRWPKAEFTFWIDGGNAVLTAPVMSAMVELQSSINRAFMLVSDGSTNLRGLSEEERSNYEAKFKIRSGSSKVGVDLQKLCSEFIQAAVGKLSSREITVIVLSFALLFGGETCWKAWLENQKEITSIEANNRLTKELLEDHKFATEADLKRMKMMADTVQSVLGSRAIIEASNEGRRAVLKAASRVKDTQIAGQRVSPDVAKPMARNAQTVSELENKSGEFDVLRVDTNVGAGFRVRLRDRSNGVEFFASVRDALVSQNDRRALERGVFEKKPIVAQVHLVSRRGVIASARIDEVVSVVGDEIAEGN